MDRHSPALRPELSVTSHVPSKRCHQPTFWALIACVIRSVCTAETSPTSITSLLLIAMSFAGHSSGDVGFFHCDLLRGRIYRVGLSQAGYVVAYKPALDRQLGQAIRFGAESG